MNRFKYGKIINGDLKFPPNEFIENGKRIVGFTEEFLIERGYKPIEHSEPPEKESVPTYVDEDDKIVEVWKNITEEEITTNTQGTEEQG